MKDNKEALRPYVADMVAVEKHILEAVERQRNDDDIKQFPDALQLVGRLESVLKSHVQALESHLQSYPGGSTASTVKQAVTGLLGAIAGVYDKVRKDTASRALRDDYTALSLASVSYGMLHTTALGLSQGPAAELARVNMEEVNSLLMELGLVLPRIVLKELAFEGYQVETGAADRAVKNLEETWRNSAQREKATAGAGKAGNVPAAGFSR
jgi:hypothetical protein